MNYQILVSIFSAEQPKRESVRAKVVRIGELERH